MENKIEKNNSFTILLDLDGVLCQFVKGVCDLYSLDYDQIMRDWKPGVWDIFSQIDVDKNKFWRRINANFWKNLIPYKEAYKLIDLCKQLTDNVYICSSPGTCIPAYEGKILWLERYLPGIEFVLTQHKELLARSKTILIDDNSKTNGKFLQNGGMIVEYPRIWNASHRYCSDPYTRCRTLLLKIFENFS